MTDPSSVIDADFRFSIAKLRDGRTLAGVVVARTERTLTLKTLGGPVSIAKTEVRSVEAAPYSLMPEGLFAALSSDQIRDLVAYLLDTRQAPLPGRRDADGRDGGRSPR